MAKQVQDPGAAQLEAAAPSDVPDITMPSPQSQRIMPINIDPPNIKTTTVLGAALSGAAQIGAAMVNRTSKMEVMEAQQRQQEALTSATLQARAQSMQQVEDVINQQEQGLDFNPDAASAAGRAKIVELVGGPMGRFLDNDTIRMLRSNLNKTVEDLTPKTTRKISEEGITTILTENASGYSVETIVGDAGDTDTRKVAWVARNHPTVWVELETQLQNGEITADQQETRIDNIINMESRISIGEKRNKLSEVNNVANQIPEVERTMSARMEAYGVLNTHMDIAEEIMAGDDFDPNVPGALTQLAMKVRSTVPQTFNTDEAHQTIVQKWGVDPHAEFGPQFQALIDARADFLIAQDPLTKAKLGAEGQVALASQSYNKLQNSINEFRNQQGVDFNMVAQFGINLGMLNAVGNMIDSQGKRSVQGDHLVKSLAVSKSTFAGMLNDIDKLPDDDDPKTADKASDILTAFTAQAEHWSNRDYLASSDVVGFVNTMSMMKEKGTFERLAPEEWAALEEVFTQISTVPEHAELFQLIQSEDTKGLNEYVMKSYFDLTRRPVKQAAEPASGERKWWN